MKTYYINMNTIDQYDAHIIDDAALEAAERGGNYLNADDFMFLCDAESFEQAKAIWVEEWNQSVFNREAEKHHP